MLIFNRSLTYCSNIFKEKKFKKLLLKLSEYSSFLKKKLNKEEIGLGLCLSNKITNEILDKDNLEYFKNWCSDNYIYISSINGFVFKSFHKKKIKELIYYPDWSAKQRIDYTKNIIKLLDVFDNNLNDFSISTIPVSFKKWVKKRNKKYIYFISAYNLLEIVNFLDYIEKIKQKLIHIDIEPEPGCFIENINDYIYFYYFWLLPLLKFFFKKDESILKKYINLCYDICHFSVNYDDHVNIIKLIKDNDIVIGKIQVSSALEIFSLDKVDLINDLSFLSKSKFLHQNTYFYKNKLKRNLDLHYLHHNKFDSARIHCHMPLYMDFYKNNIRTTSYETKNVLTLLLKNFLTKHIEIETYTYDMLIKKGKLNSIVNEYLLVIEFILNSIYVKNN